MKKILITGVTGMDGSLMADYLLKNTDYLIIGGIRRVSNPNHKNIEHLKGNSRFSTVCLDVSDQINTDQVIKNEKPDYFINFAANSFVGDSWKCPINHFETNTLPVIYQLEAIRKYVPNCRYYQAGSSEQFGDVDYSPQDLSHPFKPRSPYGASKVAAHTVVKVWRESYGLYAVQGILFNHEGIRRGSEFVTRKITQNVARIKYNLENQHPFDTLKVGNIESLRDWSDAEDFVEGIWKMLNQEKPKDYILSSGEVNSVKDFIELAFEELNIFGEWSGSDLDSKFVEGKSKKILVEIDERFFRPAEVDLLVGDPTEAFKDLGWEAKTPFEGLVKKMVRFDYENL